MAHRGVSELAGQLQSHQGKLEATRTRLDRIDGEIAQLRVLPAQLIDSNGLNDLNGLNTNAAITDVIAVIETREPLPLARVDEPVDVRIDPFDNSLTESLKRSLSEQLASLRT
jgi:hypothetical protein